MTPRPSISPLSAKASPTSIKDSTMVEPNSIPNFDVSDDDARSSSLSEPDDDDEDEILLQSDRAKRVVASMQARSYQESLEVDSEAETERLERTPDKARVQAELASRTPSKLSHVAGVDTGSSTMHSPTSQRLDLGNATSTAMRRNSDVRISVEPAAHVGEAGDKKRKRSDTPDSSLSSVEYDLDDSPRKRSHSSLGDDAAIVVSSTSRTFADRLPPSADAAAVEERESPSALDTVLVSPAKEKGRRPGKIKGKFRRDKPKSSEAEEPEAIEQIHEDSSTDALVPSAEDTKIKDSASAIFEDLAKQFTSFREKMFNEKLAALNAELELLNQSDCSHGEYLRQVACVDARYHKQVSETRAFYRFKLECLRKTTLAERSQLHSQYFQSARGLREDIMYQLGQDWYNIQKERRQSHQDKDDVYVYKFPSKKSVQVKQQAKYNKEVSILSGVAKYVGFPAAPDIKGAEGASLEDDLKAMKLSKRAQQATTHSQPVYIPNRSGLLQGQSDRLAHEQFIEQNPWARPQGQFQNHGTPNLTHTPDWAEPGLHGPNGSTRPYATSVPPSRLPPDILHATPVPAGRENNHEHTSNAIGSATERHQQTSSIQDYGSPIAVSKQRKNGRDAQNARDSNPFRNISHTSGASTIDDVPDSTEKERAIRDGGIKAMQRISDGTQPRQHEAALGKAAGPSALFGVR